MQQDKKRNFIIQKLKEGKISEEHYGTLDKMLSDYEDQLNKEKKSGNIKMHDYP
jgi:hypothetical protein